jgi:lipoate-protein ligase A
VHFGLFNDEVREELQRLQENISGADNSVTALSKTFMKYGKIVRTVGERYGNDQILEEKVKELEAANSRIWKDIQVQEGSHQKHISQLKRGHEEQLSALRKQADAGQQEKRRFEEMEQRLEDQHEKARQRMARDLKQKMSQLEIDNAGKIATLQKDKTALESANSKLEHELEKRILESEHERELHEAMQNRARTDLKKLEQALADIKGKYEMDLRPSHF